MDLWIFLWIFYGFRIYAEVLFDLYQIKNNLHFNWLEKQMQMLEIIHQTMEYFKKFTKNKQWTLTIWLTRRAYKMTHTRDIFAYKHSILIITQNQGGVLVIMVKTIYNNGGNIFWKVNEFNQNILFCFFLF